MQNQFRLSGLALAAVLCMGTVYAGAQTTGQATTTPSPLNLTVPAATVSEPQFSSSVSDNHEVAVATDHMNFVGALNAMQYGGRSRYGRPRYRGGNTNEDGSEKYTAYFGSGFTLPTGPTHHVDTTSWGIQGGVGRNFNKKFGVNVEFDWDNFALTGQTLNAQQNLYDNQILYYDNSNGYTPANPNYIAPLGGLDGYSHVWSFSLQPIYHIYDGEGLGAYVTGGFGFYHKITTFTTPEVGEYCDPYYGYCEEIAANTPIDSYTSNAPGIDGGFGFTYKFSRFSHEQLYAEARYVFMFNQARPGVVAANCSTYACAVGTDATLNDFPQNSYRTEYIPIKFGIRF